MGIYEIVALAYQCAASIVEKSDVKPLSVIHVEFGSEARCQRPLPSLSLLADR